MADKPRYTNLLLLLRVGSELIATVLVAAVALSTWGFHIWVGAVIVLVMLLLSYVAIGVLPRTIGRQHPYSVGLVAAGTTRAIGRVLSPVASLLILIGNAITVHAGGEAPCGRSRQMTPGLRLGGLRLWRLDGVGR